METFEQRVAVVTGAASGIGLAMANRFAAEGMKVVLADVEEGALEHATAVLSDQGADVIGVRTDVSSAESVEALASRAIETYGAVHVLCNNAGVAGDLDFLSNRQARVWEQPIENWEWTLGVNLWGVIYGLRAFVPLMIEHGEEGHIVNTASQAGLMSGAGGVIYGVTKHSVVRITEALYQQLLLDGSALSASVLCPGIIRTRIFSSGRNRPEDGQTGGADEGAASEEAAREADRTWQSDGLEPEEVADDVLRAIREQQLYVLTRDVPLDPIRTRMENILEQRNPEPVALRGRLFEES
jgi:NAD(P)-dependent dehydrogenase (short-subunit alcohol dehydrogenase family)